MRKVLIMGAAGRDFHNFTTVFRDDPNVEVVAFTAAQIPGIEDRTFPPSLAGPHYPSGIPIRPESELASIITNESIDEVVFAYSDLSYDDVMHRASIALAAGADYRLLGPRATMLHSSRPVIAVCATRTGAGKSQTSRRIAQLLIASGRRVALVRHPMPYGDLEAMRVQRFACLADIDAAGPTIEEREEYELPVSLGIVTYAGVDYQAILAEAADEADVIIWDGGNNDFPFVIPDLLITVVDALRPGHELHYHPGEVNVRMANVVIINKVDAAPAETVAQILTSIHQVNPSATVIQSASPVTLEPGPDIGGRRALVVEDGPTITHGGMPFGAGTVAALHAGAIPVDPRPYAVGSIAETYRRYPDIGKVLPAMGYSSVQLADLSKSIDATDCDVVIAGTPFDLHRVVTTRHPVRRARYTLEEIGEPTLPSVLATFVDKHVMEKHVMEKHVAEKHMENYPET